MRSMSARKNSGFTLVELMIVVVIVAILAMVAVPLYRANVTYARFSEGIAGAGTIRTALRVYAASHNNEYPVLSAVDGTGMSLIGIETDGLTGKYFAATDYEVTADATTYTITATYNQGGGTDTYIIDQAGAESGTITTE